MLRTLLAVLSLAVFFVFCVILIPIEWVVGQISKKAQDQSRLKIVQIYLKILLFLCGTRVTVLGRETLPAQGPVLYTPNHRSMFDIVITLAYCPSLTAYVAKKEWRKVPLLSWWIVWLHGFFLDRENIREGLKTILAAIEEVKRGTSVCIFPEGSRGRDPDERNLQPFHEGSFKIATKSGCPIVPVAISHTSRVMEDQFPRIRSTHVILQYGSPIDPGSLTGDDKKFIGKYVQKQVQQMVNANFGS